MVYFNLVVFYKLLFYGFTASSSCSRLIQYAFTNLPFYGFTALSSLNLQLCGSTFYFGFLRCRISFANLPFYRFTASSSSRCSRLTQYALRVPSKVLQIYQIYRFTLRNRHAQIVNLRLYRFTGRSAGTMEFTILRFYLFTARPGKRRALNTRLAHRHHSTPRPVWSIECAHHRSKTPLSATFSALAP